MIRRSAERFRVKGQAVPPAAGLFRPWERS